MADQSIDWRAAVRQHLTDLPISAEREIEVVEELAQDLEQRYAALLLEGVDVEVATQRVLAELADSQELDQKLARVEMTRWQAALPRSWVRAMAFEPFLQDVRYSVRMFARRPGFSAVAILAIGLGIASITTVFSLANAILFNTLPLSQFDRIVLLWQQDLTTGRDRITLSPLEYDAYSNAPRSFDAIGAVRSIRLTANIDSNASAASGIQVSANLLETLGIQPLLGRGFTAAGDVQAREALVTHEFWRTKLGGDLVSWARRSCYEPDSPPARRAPNQSTARTRSWAYFHRGCHCRIARLTSGFHSHRVRTAAGAQRAASWCSPASEPE